MRTVRSSSFKTFETRRILYGLGWLLLLLPASLPGSPPPSRRVLAQAADVGLIGALQFQEIEPGIDYAQATVGHASKDEQTGPWLINALRIDLTRAKLKVVHALDEGLGEETVSSLATRYGATAATNGGYFRVNGTYRGECVGVLMLDGKLISEPHFDREAFGLVDNVNGTEVVFGHLKFSGEIGVGSRRHEVHGLNRPVEADELVVFTPQFHRTTLTDPNVIEVVVRKGRVASVRDVKGSSQIPADGYVVSATGKSRDWLKAHIRSGARFDFSWRLSSIEPADNMKWQSAKTILGGGPQLIKNGKIEITNAQEKITPAFVNDGHPRTAIAKLDSRKLLLITVDGRQSSESIGMSLPELAKLLQELGAVEAMNLDGGGSTTMVIHNKLVNKPSDQTGERPVSDAILVFPKRN